jgi:hypothetical protein
MGHYIKVAFRERLQAGVSLWLPSSCVEPSDTTASEVQTDVWWVWIQFDHRLVSYVLKKLPFTVLSYYNKTDLFENSMGHTFLPIDVVQKVYGILYNAVTNIAIIPEMRQFIASS